MLLNSILSNDSILLLLHLVTDSYIFNNLNLLSILIPEMDYWLYTWWVYSAKPKLFYFPYSNLHRIYAIWYAADPNIFKRWEDKRKKNELENRKIKHFKRVKATPSQEKNYLYIVYILSMLLIFSVILTNTSIIDFDFIDDKFLTDVFNTDDEISDYIKPSTDDLEFIEKKRGFIMEDLSNELEDSDDEL